MSGDVVTVATAALEKEGESIDLSMPNVILPGSFNPLHWGHVGLMNAACRMVEVFTHLVSVYEN